MKIYSTRRIHMATKVLSIEIGQSLTRVVEMEFKAKNPKVFNAFTFETPADVVDDGVVKRNDAFATIIKEECAKRGIKTTQVVFTVNSSRIARRAVKIPLVKENQIQDLLNTSATDFFPVDMTQYHLVYSILGKEAKGEDKGYRLNLLAVPNDLTASYFDFAQSMGLHLAAVDYVGNSVFQLAKGAYEKGTDVLLKIDEASALVTILKDGKIQLQRNVAYGISDAIDVVRDCGAFGENLSLTQAINVLSKETCICSDMDPATAEGDSDAAVAEAKEKVTEALRRVVNMVNRVLEYYASHNPGETIDQITVMGLAGEINGFSQLLTNELNHNVRVLQDNEVNVTGKIPNSTSVHACRYAACYGAGIEPQNLVPEQGKSKKKSKESKGNGAIAGGLVVLFLGIAAAAALVILPAMEKKAVEEEIARVEAHIKYLEDAGVEAVYQEYKTAKDLAERMETIYNSTLSRSEDLVRFIEELEEKMPTTLLVLNFSANSRTVSMSIEVDSKEAAAKTLMQLRTFDSIEVVSSSGLTDNLDESDSIVSFTVECVYKPVEVKEAQ